jgi:hypothetical protein
MQHATHRATLIAISATLFAVLLTARVRISAADSAKPLTESDVLGLLQAGVPSARVSEIVDERGIDFNFTSDSEQRVRAAGGGDDAVEALRRASQRRAAADQPQIGALIVKTTPGEAQVYLNDEPKGITSVEGDIRLPDLKVGSYTLRVSLLGYQSYEKPINVAAGDAQTVYVRLQQKSSSNPGKDNPAPSLPPSADMAPSTGLPIPGVKTPTVQFYEGPHDLTLEHSKRVYRYSFDRFTTRTVYWELDLTFPAPGQRIDFQVDAIWYRADGTEMSRQKLPAHVEATWGSSWHTLGYGFPDSGHWKPGSYRVDFYYRNAQIASGTFQIN